MSSSPPPISVLVIERHGRIGKATKHLVMSPVVLAGSPVEPGRAVEAALSQKPSIVLLEVEGPETVAVVEQLMGESPCPILLLVPEGGLTRQDALKALAAGALDMLEGPARPRPEFWRLLHQQLVLLSKVKVVAHVRHKRPRVISRTAVPPHFPVIAVAASLGGPKALARLLVGLPKGLGAAMAICQHITSGFSDDLARWLAMEAGRPVIAATDGAPLVPDGIYVAGSDAHLALTADGKMVLDAGPAVGGFKPSCDVLLKSAALAFGPRAIGVVLTGMGRDGAQGLLEIRRRGGHTIAQDEVTSVVWGMPGEAIAVGAAERVLPLEAIAGQLARWVRE